MAASASALLILLSLSLVMAAPQKTRQWQDPMDDDDDDDVPENANLGSSGLDWGWPGLQQQGQQRPGQQQQGQQRPGQQQQGQQRPGQQQQGQQRPGQQQQGQQRPGQQQQGQQRPGQQQGQQQQATPTTPAPADGVLTVLPAACSCTAPEQYNPVCGSDGNTYQNRQKLSCFATCGSNVQYVRLGVCRRRQDVPT